MNIATHSTYSLDDESLDDYIFTDTLPTIVEHDTCTRPFSPVSHFGVGSADQRSLGAGCSLPNQTRKDDFMANLSVSGL